MSRVKVGMIAALATALAGGASYAMRFAARGCPWIGRKRGRSSVIRTYVSWFEDGERKHSAYRQETARRVSEQDGFYRRPGEPFLRSRKREAKT